MREPTYLEKVIAETIRPIIGALDLMQQDIEQTIQVPDAPWKILNKPYDKLSEQEILALFDIYHTNGEQTPCPMCQWMAREELMKVHKSQKELGG